MRKFFAAILLIATAITANGHEGDHDAPGSVQAPKGGQIRSLETVHLELLTEGKLAKIFVYDTKLKPADVTQYPVSATVTLPKKKPEPVQLAPKGDHWALAYDAKGAHRYTLEIDITQGGHQDKVKWTIEPKKQ